jgi:hypothetical protein
MQKLFYWGKMAYLRKVIQKEILLWYLYVSSKYFYCVVPLILTYFLSQLYF